MLEIFRSLDLFLKIDWKTFKNFNIVHNLWAFSINFYKFSFFSGTLQLQRLNFKRRDKSHAANRKSKKCSM